MNKRRPIYSKVLDDFSYLGIELIETVFKTLLCIVKNDFLGITSS